MPICAVSPQIIECLSGPQLLRGPVTNFLRTLCECYPQLTEMRFRTYVPSPGLSQRLETQGTIVPEWLADAEKRATETSTSLWDALAGMVLRERKQLPRAVYSEALVHPHNERERTFLLTRQEILDWGIDSIGPRIRDQDGLALCSEVRVLEGYTAHIPMLDFVCERDEANKATISAMLQLIGQAGVIAHSGNSYHFYGVSLLTFDEWTRFMGQALLLAPFVDARFIAHRLLDGESRLRIFAKTKQPNVPVVEECICPIQ